MSPEAIDLVSRLLKTNPKERIGANVNKNIILGIWWNKESSIFFRNIMVRIIEFNPRITIEDFCRRKCNNVIEQQFIPSKTKSVSRIKGRFHQTW